MMIQGMMVKMRWVLLLTRLKYAMIVMNGKDSQNLMKILIRIPRTVIGFKRKT